MILTDTWNTNHPLAPESQLLRRSLLGNATFSTLTGTLSLVAAASLTAAFGIPDPTFLPILGLQLLAFAGILVWLATRPHLKPGLVWTVIALDFAWVIGTAAIFPIVVDFMTTLGLVTMGLIAAIVASFAIGQILGVKRIMPA